MKKPSLDSPVQRVLKEAARITFFNSFITLPCSHVPIAHHCIFSVIFCRHVSVYLFFSCTYTAYATQGIDLRTIGHVPEIIPTGCLCDRSRGYPFPHDSSCQLSGPNNDCRSISHSVRFFGNVPGYGITYLPEKGLMRQSPRHSPSLMPGKGYGRREERGSLSSLFPQEGGRPEFHGAGLMHKQFTAVFRVAHHPRTAVFDAE